MDQFCVQDPIIVVTDYEAPISTFTYVTALQRVKVGR